MTAQDHRVRWWCPMCAALTAMVVLLPVTLPVFLIAHFVKWTVTGRGLA